MPRTPRVKVNVSLQGPLLARVRAVRDAFAFMDDADALRYLIRVGIQHVTPQLYSAQAVKDLGPFMEGQLSLAIKDAARLPPDEKPTG